MIPEFPWIYFLFSIQSSYMTDTIHVVIVGRNVMEIRMNYRVYQVKWSLKNRFISASVQNISNLKIVLQRVFIAVFVCKRLEVANGWFCCYKNQPYMHNFNKYTIFFKDINKRIESSHKVLLKLLKPHPIMIFWYYTLKFEA